MIRALPFLVVILAGCGAGEASAEPSQPAAAAPTETPAPTDDPRIADCEATGGRWSQALESCTRPQPTPDPTPEPTPVPTPAPLTFDEQLAAAENITYEDLFRNSDTHLGRTVYYRGELIQMLGEPGDWQYRINVTPVSFGYTDTVLVTYTGTDRFLEDDIVDFVGLSAGPFTYESVLGGDVTVPLLFVDESGMRLVE